MGELEALIRQIVREEVRLYLKEVSIETNTLDGIQESPQPSPSPQFDYELFEEKYQAALKFDDEVNQKYQAQVEIHGKTVTLEHASKLLNLSQYALRKLSKKDPNFPVIYKNSISTTRLFYWLDGGQAYWNLRDNND